MGHGGGGGGAGGSTPVEPIPLHLLVVEVDLVRL